MEAIYVDHANNGIPPREIIVDVTGGTALASIIASMVALKMGGRVEYVTNAYQVKVFNPEYADPLEPE